MLAGFARPGGWHCQAGLRGCCLPACTPHPVQAFRARLSQPSLGPRGACLRARGWAGRTEAVFTGQQWEPDQPARDKGPSEQRQGLCPWEEPGGGVAPITGSRHCGGRLGGDILPVQGQEGLGEGNTGPAVGRVGASRLGLPGRQERDVTWGLGHTMRQPRGSESACHGWLLLAFLLQQAHPASLGGHPWVGVCVGGSDSALGSHGARPVAGARVKGGASLWRWAGLLCLPLPPRGQPQLLAGFGSQGNPVPFYCHSHMTDHCWKWGHAVPLDPAAPPPALKGGALCAAHPRPLL